jgi:predicted enzyme related to lactoylglutathione lyase
VSNSSSPLLGATLSHVFLKVRDLTKAITFYSRILGFSVCHEERDVCAFLELHESKGLRVAFYAAQQSALLPSAGRFLMIEVNNIESTSSNLRDLGVNISDVMDVPYGRAAHFADVDGNIIEIHEANS